MSSVTEPFTVFIPVHNEEVILLRNLEILKSYLDTLGVAYEIIIGDNGSTDGTEELGRELSRRYENVGFFRISERGAGLALKDGVLKAKYRNIICVDMDLSIELSFIADSASLLSEYTIVSGSKRKGSQRRNFVRHILGCVFVELTRLLLDLPETDFSIGGKAFRKDFLMHHLDLIDRHTFYVVNLILTARKEGEKIIEIPVYCRDSRKSRFNLIHEGMYRFCMLMKTFFKEKFSQHGEDKE